MKIELNTELIKLAKAVENFNRLIRPNPAQPLPMREIAKDLISERAKIKPVVRSQYETNYSNS